MQRQLPGAENLSCYCLLEDMQRRTLAAIADTMDDMGVATSRGGGWSATQVMRILRRDLGDKFKDCGK